jgi:hypothetical protein
MKHVALASLLVLCFANSSSRSLVLHRNGALVPADTAEVVAARDLHLQALAAASAPEPEEGEGEWASEDGGEATASEEEEFLLRYDILGGLRFQQSRPRRPFGGRRVGWRG